MCLSIAEKRLTLSQSSHLTAVYRDALKIQARTLVKKCKVCFLVKDGLDQEFKLIYRPLEVSDLSFKS